MENDTLHEVCVSYVKLEFWKCLFFLKYMKRNLIKIKTISKWKYGAKPFIVADAYACAALDYAYVSIFSCIRGTQIVAQRRIQSVNVDLGYANGHMNLCIVCTYKHRQQ